MRPPSGTGGSTVIIATAPSSRGKPSTSTSDMNGPIWRGGKLTTADLAADYRVALVEFGHLRR